MVPRSLCCWTRAVVLLTFLGIFMCFNARKFVRNSAGRRQSGLVSRKDQGLGNSGPDCRSTKDPIILLLDMVIARHENLTLRYLDDCPHKCCFTFDWDGFIDTADLVGIPTASLPFISPENYRHFNQAVVLQKQAVNKEQVWLGVSIEPVIPLQMPAWQFDGVFHWIGTYRQDADVYFPYGHFEKHSPKPKRATGIMQIWDYQNLYRETPEAHHSLTEKTQKNTRTKSKKKLAAWLVSHCETRNYREIFARSLQKYITIDVYGACGNLSCPTGQSCHDYLAGNYKFYLAFENSLCLDYVSEKMWDHLERDILPISFAWINNTAALPPNSYINALDFGSIKELADYMVYLDRNDHEYRKYFQWKTKYRVLNGGNGLCATCERLWRLRKKRKRTAAAALELKRYGSMLKWLDSLPTTSAAGGNNSTVQHGKAELRVGRRKIIVNSTCVDPYDHEILLNWMRDGNA